MRVAPLVVVVALAACGDAVDDATDLGPTRTTTLVVSGQIDLTLGEQVEIPAEFPDEVPLPAGLQLEEAELLRGEKSSLFDITGWYDGDPVRAARDYLEALEPLGYEVTSRTEAPNSLFFTAANSDWLISAGFFPDPVRNVGTSVGVTVVPAADVAGS